MVDTDLIVNCQKGDQNAFEQLYKTCSTKALRTVYSISNRSDLAEDILQEAFYECYRDIGKLKTPEAFDLWFYKIIVRVCWRVLYYFNDLSVKEIAKVMNCFQSTVKTRLYKGRKKLLEELRKVPGDFSDNSNLNGIWKRGVNFERE